MGFRYTFLSKWTVLILTLVALGLTFGGYQVAFGAGQHNTALGIVGIIVGLLFYVFGWLIALLDSIQERRYGWLVILLLLTPFWIGPLAYSLVGPRNTK
jgi:hypothetical protein